MSHHNITVIHNSAAQRFEATVEGHLCVVDYRMHEAKDGKGSKVMELHHTFVDPSLQGRGIAAQLVSAALAYAREHQLKVLPTCSYVRGYMQRHAETQDLQI